jgi:CHAT domain-containing protein
MKSVVSSVSLLLAVLHLTGTISTEAVRAQAIIPTPSITGTNSIAQGHALSAQAVVPPHLSALDQEKVEEAVPLIEQTWEKDYEEYLRTNLSNQSTSVQQIAGILGRIGTQTGKKPALVYMVPRPEQLELILITPEGKPIHKRVKEANREALLKQVQELTNSVISPIRRNTTRYLPPAQQLYQWMIAPLDADLKAQNIDTLLLCVGAGLRTIPMAALHDGQQFLVEKYSFSRIPAFKLTDTVYSDLRNSRVLAMGASEFQDQQPLPAVPTELSAIMKNLWQGKSFLNQEFTLTNCNHNAPHRPLKLFT